jgi:hypothetical protein
MNEVNEFKLRIGSSIIGLFFMKKGRILKSGVCAPIAKVERFTQQQ